MQNKIDKIRGLLSELESEIPADASREAMRAFSGLELPDIIRDIVDLLMPNLKPYEAAFYWYLFRHSILQTGTPLIRASVRGLQSGLIRSAYTGSAKGSEEGTLSYSTVGDTFRSLEKIGAIRKEGDPNNDGTLYRVLLPEEISICQAARIERLKITPPRSAAEEEADYYNVRENRLKIFERDEYKCRHCGKQLTRFTATLDHVQAVVHGGDNSMGNLITACLECNSKKNSRLLSDFLADDNPTR